MGLEGRKQQRGSSPQPGQGAENGDTDRVCRTGLDTADGCETRAIPWGRDLSLAALRSPGRCHPSRAKSEAAENGAVHGGAVHGRLWRAGIVLLECQQSCAGAAVPPRHAEGHSPLSEHSQDTACQELLPPRRAGKTLCTAWMEARIGEREMSLLRHLQGGEGHRRAAKALGSRQRLCPPAAPKRDGHRAGAFPASNILLHPLPTDTSAALLPRGIAARVPATPLHQLHGSHPQAQEIHMSRALQQHKGSSLLAVGIRS